MVTEKLHEMGSEKSGRKSPSPVGQRRRLSDITNIQASTGRTTKPHDDMVASQLAKGSAVPLQKENIALKKKLEEKEAIIEAQKHNLDKLWQKCCQQSRQNNEVIQHNKQLYKDSLQARDKLRILQHENVQMGAVISVLKISNAELQLKLDEALDQVHHLQLETSTTEKAFSDKQPNIPTVLTKLVQSRARRTFNACETSGDSTLDCATKVMEDSAENSVTCRPTLRRRESTSYKEPSLRVKLRQGESENSSSQITPLNNRCKTLIEGLQKVNEDQEFNLAVSSISCNSEAETVNETLSSISCQTSAEYLTVSTATTANKARHTQSMSSAESVQSTQRRSSGRPHRRAVGSVGTYKEPPLNTKMRRSE